MEISSSTKIVWMEMISIKHGVCVWMEMISIMHGVRAQFHFSIDMYDQVGSIS